MSRAADAPAPPPSTHKTGHFADASLATRLIHVGQEPDEVTGAVTVPISLATTFAQASPGELRGRESDLSYHKGFDYSRTGNPSRTAYEKCYAAAENGKYAIAFASGTAAISACIHLLNSGDHIVCMDDEYEGTPRFLLRVAKPTYGIDSSFVDLTVDGALEGAVTAKTRMLWLETPTNPTLKIVDLARMVAFARSRNILVAVDNTFMTPVFQRPLELGADISLSSVSKFINGHADVIGGIIAVNRDDLNDKLRYIQNAVGAVPSPFDCYMTCRGMKTLPLRMERHAHNAAAVAHALERHSRVDKVLYPGLPSHPQHAVATKQMSGYGSIISFYIKGNERNARAFLENLKLFTVADSLGAVESLAECPALMTHACVPEEAKRELGISPNLIRLSVGIEGERDLVRDIINALDKSAVA